MNYDYTSDDLTEARVGGWDDRKKMILELLKKRLRKFGNYSGHAGEYIDENVIEEIENENFGIIDLMPITKIHRADCDINDYNLEGIVKPCNCKKPVIQSGTRKS